MAGFGWFQAVSGWFQVVSAGFRSFLVIVSTVKIDDFSGNDNLERLNKA